MNSMNYQKAGVDIEVADMIVDAIKDNIHKTHSNAVLSSIGGFAGLYDLKEIISSYKEPILVQSIDGVGTKSLVASMSNQYEYIGQDLVSATVNDILITGARPLTLLDYVAASKLSYESTTEIINGIARACRDADISLVGGETAEMPSVYADKAYDVVGIVTGVVEKSGLIDGRRIETGDKVYVLPSSGLHTNGYSLARKVLFDIAKLNVDTMVDDLGMTIGEALLVPHKNYCRAVSTLCDTNIDIHGMAHITGGGIKGNLSRILPDAVDVVLSLKSIDIPPIFHLIQTLGKVSLEDMYQAFNMGAGYIIITSSDDASCLEKTLTDAGEPFVLAGEVVVGDQLVRFA